MLKTYLINTDSRQECRISLFYLTIGLDWKKNSAQRETLNCLTTATETLVLKDKVFKSTEILFLLPILLRLPANL